MMRVDNGTDALNLFLQVIQPNVLIRSKAVLEIFSVLL